CKLIHSQSHLISYSVFTYIIECIAAYQFTRIPYIKFNSKRAEVPERTDLDSFKDRAERQTAFIITETDSCFIQRYFLRLISGSQHVRIRARDIRYSGPQSAADIFIHGYIKRVDIICSVFLIIRSRFEYRKILPITVERNPRNIEIDPAFHRSKYRITFNIYAVRKIFIHISLIGFRNNYYYLYLSGLAGFNGHRIAGKHTVFDAVCNRCVIERIRI